MVNGDADEAGTKAATFWFGPLGGLIAGVAAWYFLIDPDGCGVRHASGLCRTATNRIGTPVLVDNPVPGYAVAGVAALLTYVGVSMLVTAMRRT